MKRQWIQVFALMAIAGCGIDIGWTQSEAVQALQARLLAPNAVYVVKIPGLHATTDALGRPSEVRIQDGAISRGISAWVHGTQDMAVPVGQVVRVVGVEPSSDRRSDLLRLNVVAKGVPLPLVFVLPKGSLAGMSEPQLEALVNTALEPARSAPESNTAAPPQAPSASAPSEPTVLPLDTPAVQGLKARLVNGQLTFLKAGNLRGAMSSPDFVHDNLVTDGAIDRSNQTNSYRGMRSMGFPPYQQVQLIDIRAFSDDQHDVLKIVARAPIGGFIPIAFLLAKGSLVNMTEPQLERLVDPVVGLPGQRNPHPPDDGSL